MRYLIVILALAACTSHAQPSPSVDVQHYTFRLTLSDASDVIEGETIIDVIYREADVETVAFDLIGKGALSRTGMTVSAVHLDDTPLSYTHEDDRIHITLPSPAGAGAEHRFTVTYSGVPADGLVISTNKYGDRTFFGDNWPDRARHWLATIDHPSDKALVDWEVTAPAHYQVVGNGLLVEEVDHADATRTTYWRTNVPLATKLMVIGVAQFAVQHDGMVNGIPVQHWTYPQDRTSDTYTFTHTKRIIQYFEDTIGDYSYAKLANVQSKTRFGGMENASNIFYNENNVGENLIAHEVAHQWFGNSVTEIDWPHVWLSEGFATYLTMTYREAIYGRDTIVPTLEETRRNVIAFHRENPDRPVIDTTVTDLMRYLNANSYQKGGWVLHMLRYRIGDDAFFAGLRVYYDRYRNGNASTTDLRRVMEETSGEDLRAFFNQWLRRPGQPRVEGTWSYDPSRNQLTVQLAQTHGGAPFKTALEIGIYTNDSATPRVEIVDLDQAEHTFTFALDGEPGRVALDPNVWLLMEGDVRER